MDQIQTYSVHTTIRQITLSTIAASFAGKVKTSAENSYAITQSASVAVKYRRTTSGNVQRKSNVLFARVPVIVRRYTQMNNGRSQRFRQTAVSEGGELQNTSVKVVSECTNVCGDTKFPGKSCAKIILVHIYPKYHIDLAIKAYAVIDDQSNSTLGTPELFDRLGIEGEEIPYVLSSCNGKIQTSGRRAHNLIIESFDSSVALNLPVVTECDVIPDNRNEIPTPDITRHYPHLHNLEYMIPPIDGDAKIVLLVGRDLLKAHHVLVQRIGSDSAPYAQKLPLGWTIVGESCLRRCHPSIKAFKTNILKCGRPSFFESCPNDIEIKQKMVPFAGSQRTTSSNIGQDVFAKTPDDEKISFSRDDRDFLAIMEDGFVRGENGNWIAPLPFRKDRLRLENNLTHAPLPEQDLDRWDRWRSSLVELNNVKIPRLYLSSSFSACEQKTVHVFCDASEKAIAAVGYLQGTLPDGRRSLGFVLGKAKVAPLHGHSIPRLEFCSALLAVEIAETISNHLGLALQDFRFYSDSKVVLGYIYNTARRFHTYVANRVARILSSTSSRQWSYVMTDNNPADQGTRSLRPSEMKNSTWLIGPTSLVSEVSETAETYELHNPDSDNEIRRITTIKTDVHVVERLGCERFARFSRWESLLKAIIFLKLVARSVSKPDIDQKNDSANKHRQDSTHFLLKNAKRESYPEEIQSLQNNKPLSNSSYIRALSPFLDDNGLIRVGGRLERAQIPYEEKHPILLPGRHHISLLLARHFHEKVFHQGRHFTEGSIRAAGYWFTGCRRLVSSLISQCVKCRKLRGNYCCQKMADLPADRLEPGPPFSNVGVDAFGPWKIVSRRTRGGIANSKRWGIIFTCLVTRAVHIEVVDSMSSSAFINALRRFIAIRGKVNIFRSDRGTNLVGAMDDLGLDRISVENNVLREFFDNVGTKWILNPPHAPHFGGAWERLIGIVKRILSAILSEPVNQHLTHDVFCTLMAEVTAIVNQRPLLPVSNDPENPSVLSPSTILTQKFDNNSELPDFENFTSKDMIRSEWKRVQVLADRFWTRWKKEYMQTLQLRRKWHAVQPDLKHGDVVLLKDIDAPRNRWPLAVIVDVMPSDDSHVRKVQLKISRNNKSSVLTRPVCELVPLLKAD